MRLLLFIAIAVLPLVTFGQTPFSFQDQEFLQSASPLRKDLAGFWRLEETSGTRYDCSKNGNHLTDNNGVTFNGGKISGAAGFNSGSLQYLSVANNSTIEVGNIDFSLAVWFYIATAQPSLGSFSPIFTKWLSTGNARQFALVYDNGNFSPSNDVAFCVSSNGTFGATNFVVSGGGQLALNTWHFAAAGHDSVNDKIWLSLNGGARQEKSYGLGVASTATELQIGRANSVYLLGRVDNPGMWKRTLTTNEVSQLYSSGNGATFPSFRLNSSALNVGTKWTTGPLVVSGGRLDAMVYIDPGIIVVGSRSPNGGHIYRSTDTGASWADLGVITGTNEVSSLAVDGSGATYLLDRWAHVYKSTDSGATWSASIATVSTNSPGASKSLTYEILPTPAGSLLVCDTLDSGGHVFRSTDGGTNWTDIGALSTSALYRFLQVGDGILVFGWAGRVYKSTNDGVAWSDKGLISASPLFAPAYLGSGICVLGSDGGGIYRSTDNGETWALVKSGLDGCDDASSFSNGLCVMTTYTSALRYWMSYDWGLTWANCGAISTPAASDFIENVVELPGRRGAAVSNKGYFLSSP